MLEVAWKINHKSAVPIAEALLCGRTRGKKKFQLSGSRTCFFSRSFRLIVRYGSFFHNCNEDHHLATQGGILYRNASHLSLFRRVMWHHDERRKKETH